MDEKQVARIITQMLDQQTPIDELYYRSFFAGVADHLLTETNLDLATAHILRQADLRYDAEETAARGEANAFDLGAIWAVSAMVEAYWAAREQVDIDAEIQEKMAKHLELLKAIADEPGISQVELARKLGQTLDEVTNVVMDLASYGGIVRIRRYGRELQLALTDKAKSLM